MRRIGFALLETLAAAVFLAPIFWLYGRAKILERKTVLPYTVFACYLGTVFYLVGLPNITYVRFEPRINWVPLIGMVSDFRNACLNVLLFVPLGIFLPVFWEKYRNWRSAAWAGLALSCLIECLQIFTFRATDVNDLITNTLGSVIGFLLARVSTRNFVNYVFREQNEKDWRLVLATVLAVMVLGQPFVSGLFWNILL